MTGEPLTQRDTEAIRLYVEEGLTLKEVGARLGVSPSKVSAILQKAGVSRRRPGRPSPVVARRKREIIRAYVQEGLFLKEVGARFSLSLSAVWRVLAEAGVPRRSRSWRSGWPWRDAAQRSEEITHAYLQEGLSPKEIALRFGLSQECVRRILATSGAKRRSRDVVRANQEIVRAYLEEGLTLREVAKRFGVTPRRVAYILGRADVRRKHPQAK